MCLYFSATIVFLLFTSFSARGAHGLPVEFEPWGNWSECSTTCSYGVEVRTRICPTNVDCNLEEVGQMRLCKIRECPIDGGWSHWSAWTRCSTTCGENGRQRRARSCTNPVPKYNGIPCQGAYIEHRSCEGLAACPVHGGWSEWSDWGPCSARKCWKHGLQFKTRTCDNPAPSQGGLRCSGQQSDKRKCSKPGCHVDGGWSEWGEWGECSVTCGSRGVQTSTRLCNNPVRMRKGRPCSGRSSRKRPCPDLELCPGEESTSFSDVDVDVENSDLSTEATTNEVTSVTSGLWWSLDSTLETNEIETHNWWGETSAISSESSGNTDSASYESDIQPAESATTAKTTTQAMVNEGINCDDLGDDSSFASWCN